MLARLITAGIASFASLIGACASADEMDSYERSLQALDFSFESMKNGYSGAAPYKCEYDGNAITYLGNTSLQLVNCLLEAPANANKLIITSPGGNVEHAWIAAFLMKGKGFHVEVIGWCASSCANYILPAARRVTVNEHSVVYVHGAPKKYTREEIEANWPREKAEKQMAEGKSAFAADTYETFITEILKRANISNDLHENFRKHFEVGEKLYQLIDIYEYQASIIEGHSHSLIVVTPAWLEACLPGVTIDAAPPNLTDIAKLFPTYSIVTMSDARGQIADCFAGS